MALTPDEIDALPTYSNAQMAKLVGNALAELASNPDQASVTVNGRSWTQQQIPALRELLVMYQQLAASDAEAAAVVSGAGAPTVRFQESL